MKRIISLLLIVVICFSLCSCFGGSIKGTYVSESEEYSVEFKSGGVCTWYQDGTFFEGTYKKTDEGWQLDVKGHSGYSNTVFQAEKSGRNLIITGGVVYGELFIKQ